MIKRVNISLSEAGRRVFAAAPRLVGITLMVMRLFGNFVAVKRRRCRGYLATALRLLGGVAAVIWQLRCGYTVNLAALPRLVGITLAVMRLFAAVIWYARCPT